MARTAFSFAKEELLPRRWIAGHVAFCCLGIERPYESRQSIEVLSREIKRRHARIGNPVLNNVAQPLNRHSAHPGVPGQSRTLVGAAEISSMATDAMLRVHVLASRQICRGSGRGLRQQQRQP